MLASMNRLQYVSDDQTTKFLESIYLAGIIQQQMRGQCYDRESVMNRHIGGVQTTIRLIIPRACRSFVKGTNCPYCYGQHDLGICSLQNLCKETLGISKATRAQCSCQKRNGKTD